MARRLKGSPRPAPSPRVWAAIAIAALIGAVTFVIWWSTSPAGHDKQTTAVPPAAQPAAAPPKVEYALPRGGSLTGSLPTGTDPKDAIALLTGAPLFRVNRSTDQVEPWLAESSATSSDNLRYTIKLRPNVQRADGSPLVAADVASWLTAHPPSAGVITPAFRAVDALTLEMSLPSPFAPALRLLDSAAVPDCGPFVLKQQTPAGRLTFARNPHYWRPAPDGKPLPYLDSLVLEARAARPDQLDFNENIRPSDYRALRNADEAGKLRLYDLGPGLDADALWLNLWAPAAKPAVDAKPWLRNAAFRQAMSAAIDRRRFCDTVFAGMCDPLAGPVTPGSATWFMPDLPAAYDPNLARTTLAGLNLQDRNRDQMLDDEQGRPVRFTVLVPTGVDTIARGAEYLRDGLKKIGIAVVVLPLDPARLHSRWEKGDYEAIYDRIPVPDTDPALNLEFWLSSGRRHMWNPRQQKPATDWEKQIDQLLLKQASSSNRVDRVQLFADAQRVFAGHLPALYFGTPYIYVATSMRVLNARPSNQRPAMLWNADVLAAGR
jgi:peptide/nickel transport system substrate-binding protein